MKFITSTHTCTSFNEINKQQISDDYQGIKSCNIVVHDVISKFHPKHGIYFHNFNDISSDGVPSLR